MSRMYMAIDLFVLGNSTLTGLSTIQKSSKATTTTFNVDFPSGFLLTAPRCMLSPDLVSATFSIEKLADNTYRATKHACSAHTLTINFQVTIQKGEQMSCRVRRIFKEIDLVESYLITSMDGKFQGGASEIGLVGKLAGYGIEDVKRDEFLASLTGAFFIEMMTLEEEESEDGENMVESAETWDWEAWRLKNSMKGLRNRFVLCENSCAMYCAVCGNGFWSDLARRFIDGRLAFRYMAE